MLLVREDAWMDTMRSCDPAFGYNMANATRTFVSKENGRKISEALLALHRHLSKESREKLSKERKGMVFTEEHKKKLSAARKGVPRKPFTDETRKKMSSVRMGHVNSEATRKKISAANLRWWKNKRESK